MFKSEIADGMRIDWDVEIPVDDGLSSGPISTAPWRRAVIRRFSATPLREGLPFQVGYPSAWNRMAEQHSRRDGRVDQQVSELGGGGPREVGSGGIRLRESRLRGTGRSPGYIDHFSPRETQDFYECIEWSGVQPWSNGKVGLNGISYYGINQWHVASLQPPHLAALCIWEGAADWYRDMTHHGGIVSTFWANWYDMQVKTVQHGVGEEGGRNPNTGQLICGDEELTEEELSANRCAFGEDIVAHPLDDEYHKDRSPQWDKVVAPLLTAANWGGQGSIPGELRGFLPGRLRAQMARAHGIEHWTHFYTDYGREMQLRFLIAFSKTSRRGGRLSPKSSSRSATPMRFSSNGGRPTGPSRAPAGPSTTSIPTSHCRQNRRRSRQTSRSKL